MFVQACGRTVTIKNNSLVINKVRKMVQVARIAANASVKWPPKLKIVIQGCLLDYISTVPHYGWTAGDLLSYCCVRYPDISHQIIQWFSGPNAKNKLVTIKNPYHLSEAAQRYCLLATYRDIERRSFDKRLSITHEAQTACSNTNFGNCV